MRLAVGTRGGGVRGWEKGGREVQGRVLTSERLALEGCRITRYSLMRIRLKACLNVASRAAIGNIVSNVQLNPNTATAD